MQELFRENFLRVLKETRTRVTRQRQEAVGREFHRLGRMEIELKQTILDDYICRIWQSSLTPPKRLVYLFVVNGTVRYVGETKNGLKRFDTYRYGGGKSRGRRISDHLFDELIDGKNVEVYYKEAPSDRSQRRKMESRYIRFFGTRPGGWNRRC